MAGGRLLALALLLARPAAAVEPPPSDPLNIKLRSESWEVLIRMDGDQGHLERVAANCGGRWVNGCYVKSDPIQRQAALQNIFREGVVVEGDFQYCSRVVVRQLPADMARELIRPSPAGFCAAFAGGSPAVAAGSPVANPLLQLDDHGAGVFVAQPAPAPVSTGYDADLAALLADIPTHASQGALRTEPGPPVGSPMAVSPPAGAPLGTPVASAPGALVFGAPPPVAGGNPASDDDWLTPGPVRPGPEPAPTGFGGAPGRAVARAPEPAAVRPPDAPLLELEDDSAFFRPGAPAPAPAPVDSDLLALLAPVPTIQSEGALRTQGGGGAPVAAPAATTTPAREFPRPVGADEAEPLFEGDAESKGALASLSGAPIAGAPAAGTSSPGGPPAGTAPRAGTGSGAGTTSPPPPSPTGRESGTSAPRRGPPSEFDLEDQEAAGVGRIDRQEAETKRKKGEEPVIEVIAGQRYLVIDLEDVPEEHTPKPRSADARGR